MSTRTEKLNTLIHLIKNSKRKINLDISGWINEESVTPLWLAATHNNFIEMGLTFNNEGGYVRYDREDEYASGIVYDYEAEMQFFELSDTEDEFIFGWFSYMISEMYNRYRGLDPDPILFAEDIDNITKDMIIGRIEFVRDFPNAI